MATKNDDASSADSSSPVIDDEQHRGIVDKKRVSDMKRKASVNYYDWPIEKKASKAAKKKRDKSNKECAKFMEQIVLQSTMMIEIKKREANRLRDEADRLRDEATEREMEHMSDWETMSVVTNDMSPNSKEFWRQEKRQVVMRRMSEWKDGTSNMDRLNE